MRGKGRYGRKTLIACGQNCGAGLNILSPTTGDIASVVTNGGLLGKGESRGKEKTIAEIPRRFRLHRSPNEGKIHKYCRGESGEEKETNEIKVPRQSMAVVVNHGRGGEVSVFTKNARAQTGGSTTTLCHGNRNIRGKRGR